MSFQNINREMIACLEVSPLVCEEFHVWINSPDVAVKIFQNILSSKPILVKPGIRILVQDVPMLEPDLMRKTK